MLRVALLRWLPALAAGLTLVGLAPAGAALAATVAVVVAATVVPATAAVPVTRHPGTVLPTGVHARLEASGAFSGNPVRFLMLGDSLAITASVGLAVGSVPGYGVQVIDEGVFGCDYDSALSYSEGQPVTPYTTCLQWRALYAADLARTHPDVVGLLTTHPVLAGFPPSLANEANLAALAEAVTRRDGGRATTSGCAAWRAL